jgi:hypothetical protein
LAFGNLGKFSIFSSSFLCFLSVVICWCWQCTNQGEDCEHKVDMCPCGLSLWRVIVNMTCILGWVWELTMAWVGLCDMSLGLWCASVELRGGGRRQGEGQIGMCRADGPGAVKDRREA